MNIYYTVMNEKELDQLAEKEQYDVKYMSELRQYFNAYMYALINEIYTGVAVNLGLPEKKAYYLAKNNPNTLEKANFFKSIFEKFKNIFSHKVPKFRYNQKSLYNNGKPMTPDQWDTFNNSLDKYFKEQARQITEDMGIKSYLLGRETTEYREEKKAYKNKSLFQVAQDQFGGNMPENIAEAYRKYDFKNSEKNIINQSISDIGMYITQTSNDLQESIHKQIQIGLENEKGPVQMASDLYWQVEKGRVNPYTAEAQRKNWNRIATTELAMVYEAGILAPYESQAMESMKDPLKAVYFVRTGGSCPWCLSVRGTVVRMVPKSIVKDPKNESLSSMGIKDPNTNIAIWPGKNNVGLKQREWMIACPAHPYNVATFQPIDLSKEEYNQDNDDVVRKPIKDQFIPDQKDYVSRSKEEKEDRKPRKIAGGLVEFNNNTYEAVSSGEYNKKLEAWKKDTSKPIPVNENSPSYERIFGRAK